MSKATEKDPISARPGQILSGQLREFNRLRKMVLKWKEPEPTHDLRVASRRMRATLKLFAPFIARKRVKYVSKKFRRITRELGKMRNLDEAISFFSQSTPDLSDLVERLVRIRECEVFTIMETLKEFPRSEMKKAIHKASFELSDAVADGSQTPLMPAYLAGISILGYQEIHNLSLQAANSENTAARHAFRIAIKKWRYALETIGQVLKTEYGPVLELLKEYQTVLGRLNDMKEFALLCDAMELTPDYRARIDRVLNNTREQFLARFSELLKSQPLHYNIGGCRS